MKLSELKLECDYLELENNFYQIVNPTPLEKPHLISLNKTAANLIDVDENTKPKEWVDFLNGTWLAEGSTPFAMCYAGHQFGHFVPRLGDGRAINLGSTNGWHLQLKGAGETLYSRQGDGRAVTRSSIREYLISEAMHALGIPTTRALAIIGSDEDVARERWEKGAIVLRMSKSWVRFGTFEYFYYANEHSKLEQLADYVIKQSYSHLDGKQDAYYLMFQELVERTAKLLAQWQAYGFNHGVMNTDNMSIAGLTIDYGPYAFLDDYDFEYVCNHTDRDGRYSYGNQPTIAYWNLGMLARALSPLISYQRLEELLKGFEAIFDESYTTLMSKKLGLFTSKDDDLNLVEELLQILEDNRVDYTAFFRTLSNYELSKNELKQLCSNAKELDVWLDKYDKRLKQESTDSSTRSNKMRQINPKYVLKNYILQDAISKAEKHDFTGVEELLKLAQFPFEEHEEMSHYASTTPSNYKNIQLSCSS